MYDYYLGGSTNYPADRKAAQEVIDRAPEIREIARVNRDFLGRAVRFLAADAGIRQFIDVGTGIPTDKSVHGVLTSAVPGARVVYVDYDPIVNTYARTLVGDTESTGIVMADLRDPDAFLNHPVTRQVIDFGAPVGMLLFAVLHFISDAENPAGILAALRDSLPAGSYLAFSHVTAESKTDALDDALTSVYRNAASPVTLRGFDEVRALLEGWDLVDPGLVQASLWRPDSQPGPAGDPAVPRRLCAGVARRP